jgi:hypothetical protein
MFDEFSVVSIDWIPGVISGYIYPTLFPCNAVVTNEWSFTSTPAIRSYEVDRGKSTFVIYRLPEHEAWMRVNLFF